MSDPLLEQAILCVAAIKDAIADKAEAVAPKARVHRQFIFGEPEENWPGLLRSDLDVNDQGNKRIHAISVFYDGLDQELESAIASMTPILPIGVAFHLEDYLGITSNNSEDRMMAEMVMLKWALFYSPQLGLDDVDDELIRGCVESHRGLTMPRMGMRTIGDKPTRVCAGRIEVVMSPQQR